MKTKNEQKQIQEINEDLARLTANEVAMEVLEAKRVNKPTEEYQGSNSEGLIDLGDEEKEEKTTKSRLIELYKEMKTNQYFAKNIEAFKEEFPLVVKLLKSNTSKPVGEIVYKFCKKHYVTCKKGFGFLYFKHLLEIKDEKVVLERWNQEYLDSLEEKNLRALELDL